MSPLAGLIPASLYDAEKKLATPAASTSLARGFGDVSAGAAADTTLAKKFLQVNQEPSAYLNDALLLLSFYAAL